MSANLSSRSGVGRETVFPCVIIKSTSSTGSVPECNVMLSVSGSRVNLNKSCPLSLPYFTLMPNLFNPTPVSLISTTSSPCPLSTFSKDLPTVLPTACDSSAVYFLPASSSNFSVLGSTSCTSIPLSVYFLISESDVPFLSSTAPFSTSSNCINFFIC